jgi:hypothetical protein
MMGAAKVLDILSQLEAGKLQKHIAADHGISPAMVSRIGAGKRYPTVRGTFAAIQFSGLLITLACTGAP